MIAMQWAGLGRQLKIAAGWETASGRTTSGWVRRLASSARFAMFHQSVAARKLWLK
jgi:hypothetical protein